MNKIYIDTFDKFKNYSRATHMTIIVNIHWKLCK